MEFCLQSPFASQEGQGDDAVVVMSKEVYDSELHWGRLVIPGKYVPHFRRLQEDMHCKGDYHLWVEDPVLERGYDVGVKMTIMRPMLVELHPLFHVHKVTPGDTLVISQSSSTGQLWMSMTKGMSRGAEVEASSSFGGEESSGTAQQPKPSGRRSRSSSLDLGDCGTPSSSRRPRRAARGRYVGVVDSDAEEDEEELSTDDDGQLESYTTGSGRTVMVRRFGSGSSGRSSNHHEGGAGARLGSRQSSATINLKQPGCSEELELESPVHDMSRFDALVNVAVEHFCT